jgi:molybdopterin-containing oxidoreductase family iron-sulfur binding subunit
MVIDLKKCVGCNACSVSCKGANGTPQGVLRSWVQRTEDGVYPDTIIGYIPKLCNHCDNPLCVAVCPAEATWKREEDGIVVIDIEKCIGCNSCVTACPYEARYPVATITGYYGSDLTDYETLSYPRFKEHTVDKCDFCLSRTGNSETPNPACVAACVAQARIFGEIADLRSVFSERNGSVLLPELGTEPNIVYLPDLKY